PRSAIAWKKRRSWTVTVASSSPGAGGAPCEERPSASRRWIVPRRISRPSARTRGRKKRLTSTAHLLRGAEARVRVEGRALPPEAERVPVDRGDDPDGHERVGDEDAGERPPRERPARERQRGVEEARARTGVLHVDR